MRVVDDVDPSLRVKDEERRMQNRENEKNDNDNNR